MQLVTSRGTSIQYQIWQGTEKYLPKEQCVWEERGYLGNSNISPWLRLGANNTMRLNEWSLTNNKEKRILCCLSKWKKKKKKRKGKWGKAEKGWCEGDALNKLIWAREGIKFLISNLLLKFYVCVKFTFVIFKSSQHLFSITVLRYNLYTIIFILLKHKIQGTSASQQNEIIPLFLLLKLQVR